MLLTHIKTSHYVPHIDIIMIYQIEITKTKYFKVGKIFLIIK